jgi:hypothetical protein
MAKLVALDDKRPSFYLEPWPSWSRMARLVEVAASRFSASNMGDYTSTIALRCGAIAIDNDLDGRSPTTITSVFLSWKQTWLWGHLDE